MNSGSDHFPSVERLQARLHTGELTTDRLELAAYCGGDVAAEALGQSQGPPQQVNDVWAAGLQNWGAETIVRAAVALARHFSSDWRSGVGTGDLESGLRAVEQWVLCPCGDHRREALERRVTAGGWGWFNRSAETIPKRATWKMRRAGMVAELAALAIEELAAPGTFPNFWAQLWQTTLPLPTSASKTTDSTNVRSAIAAELVPWAIGFRDPVAERLTGS